MSSSVGATVARKAQRAGAEIQRAGPTAMSKASLGFKRTIEGSIRKVAPSMRMSGVGRKGAKLGVRYDIKGAGGALIKSFFNANGPLHLLERNTKAHEIRPRGRRGQAVRLRDGGIRRSVRHPGTKGKHPFEKGVTSGRDDAMRVLRNAHSDAIKRGLRS